MNPDRHDELLDAFLREVADADGGEAIDRLVDGFADASDPLPAPADGRAALLGAVDERGRFSRFAARIAAMIDLGRERAQALLDGLADAPWEPGPVPGCDLYWVEGGPARRGYVRGFVRVRAGLSFPNHEHLGDEEVLVLQGHLIEDDGRRVGPGDTATRPAGSRHGYLAEPGGADLLYFTVVREGVRIGDHPVLHRDGD